LVRRPEWSPELGWFLYAIWAALFLGAFAFVRRYGSNVPWWDDWHFLVPVVTGKQALTPAWLWAQAGPHRLALPKLIDFILFQVSGGRLHAPMYFNAVCLCSLSFAMIQVAKTVRGRISYTDAFFPLLMLH
jgi:hypothetical protein